jgi:hypothetical protein
LQGLLAFLGALKASPTPGLAFLAEFVEFVERVIKDLDLIAHWHAAIQQSFGIPALRPPASVLVLAVGPLA